MRRSSWTREVSSAAGVALEILSSVDMRSDREEIFRFNQLVLTTI